MCRQGSALAKIQKACGLNSLVEHGACCATEQEAVLALIKHETGLGYFSTSFFDCVCAAMSHEASLLQGLLGRENQKTKDLGIFNLVECIIFQSEILNKD